jgi:hypothetical protein
MENSIPATCWAAVKCRHNSEAWWHMSVNPALGSQRQEDLKFEASLGYTAKILSQKNKGKRQVY